MKIFFFVHVTLCIFDLAFGAIPTGKITFKNGTEFIIQHPVPELPPDEEITDVCVIGTFAVYTGTHFEIDGIMSMYWYYPPNDTGLHCWDDNYLMGSARTMAHEVDTLTPFAALYSGYAHQYHEEVITGESSLSDVPFRIESILMRKSSLELYSEQNFEGERFCVLDCSGLICDISFMGEIPGDHPFYLPLAKSARIGCTQSENTIVSRAVAKSSNYSGYKVFSK